MTQSLTGDWTRILLHSTPALYHKVIEEAVTNLTRTNVHPRLSNAAHNGRCLKLSTGTFKKPFCHLGHTRYQTNIRIWSKGTMTENDNLAFHYMTQKRVQMCNQKLYLAKCCRVIWLQYEWQSKTIARQKMSGETTKCTSNWQSSRNNESQYHTITRGYGITTS